MAVSAFAATQDLNKDITMVSYEQGWLDDEGTLALRNNTTGVVQNVSFVITYLDMAGNEMDYKTFNKHVEIAPGKTKKLNIPGYESDRHYYYYKSEGGYTGHPAFKIKFELTDCDIKGRVENISEGQTDKQKTESTPEVKKKEKKEKKTDKDVSKTMEPHELTYNYPRSSYSNSNSYYIDKDDVIWGIILLLFVISLMVGLYALVATMARERGRSATLWVFLSMFLSPVLVIFILLIIGNDYNSPKGFY